MLTAAPLKQTALNVVHRSMGAKMVDFGGWDMPVQYSSLVEEHLTVRKSVGLFDVSHMGEIDITGPDAARLADFVTTNGASRLKLGQIQYSGVLYDHGGFVDDVLIHKVADDHFFLCVNASNQDKDFEHIRAQNHFDAEVRFSSDDYAQLALQGRNSRATLAKLTAVDLGAIRYYWFTDGVVSGTPARIARTGYTGEDGFEIMLPAGQAVSLWSDLIAADVGACGLGARDTLRLEAGMNLYGQDMDESVTPMESGLAWTVDLSQERDFSGRGALTSTPPRATQVGLALLDRGVLRSHQTVRTGHGEGMTTSGSFSPTLGLSIALARVPLDVAVGEPVQVHVREKWLAAKVVRYPFVRNGKSLLDPAALESAARNSQ